MSETNINNIITSLTNNNWAVLYNMTSEEGWKHFIDIVFQVIDKFASEKELIIPKITLFEKPWMSPKLLKSS